MSEFDEMMNYDPLRSAERITGKDYDTDRETGGLAFALLHGHAEVKRDELALRDDTYREIAFEEGLRILLSEGFEVVYTEDFAGSLSDDPGHVERFVVAFSRTEGILATLTSYLGQVGSLDITYQWEPTDTKDRFAYTESGRYCRDETRWVWMGRHELHDGGLRHTLAQLRDHGSFLPVWLEPLWIWLIHSGHERQMTDRLSKKSFDAYDQINRSIFAQLPSFVRDALKPRFRD